MMGPETLSLLVWCKYDLQTDTAQVQIIDVRTAQHVRLRGGGFLLRISRDEQAGVERCLIRHIASGREAYVQSGPRLREFMKACLLEDNAPPPTGSNSTGG